MASDTDRGDDIGTENEIGGESAKFMSDGLTLLLENGRSVRPQLRTPGEREPWIATWVDPKKGEVGIGPEVDDVRAILYLSPAKAVFDDEGVRVWHYEWNGWLYCDREQEVVGDFEPGTHTCPYCEDEIEIPEPKPVEETA